MFSMTSYTQGIKVAEFQMDGKFSDKTYLNYTGNLGPNNNLTKFTLCQRFNMNYIRGPTTCIFSYASDINDNAIITFLRQGGNH